MGTIFTILQLTVWNPYVRVTDSYANALSASVLIENGHSFVANVTLELCVQWVRV